MSGTEAAVAGEKLCGRSNTLNQHSPLVEWNPVACETPVPDWKKLDVVQDVLPERDKANVRAARRAKKPE